FREAATLIMLLAVGIITGRSFAGRFAWFLYSFAVWDIFYYLFLKLLIGWPESFLTWDVLFLIPVTWTGPVISPLIVCIFMISLSGLIIHFSAKGLNTRIKRSEWIMLLSGAIILIIAFVWDYSGFILEHYSISELWNLPDNKPLFDLATRYIPRKFNWWIFSLGSLVIISAILLYYRRMKAKTSNTLSQSTTKVS
ncbi:MAG: hypothetical protein K8R35_04515, partial [Bacteroidales bacterium]|nr:hypothetical protein [Bacteroidales bacterium]